MADTGGNSAAGGVGTGLAAHESPALGIGTAADGADPDGADSAGSKTPMAGKIMVLARRAGKIALAPAGRALAPMTRALVPAGRALAPVTRALEPVSAAWRRVRPAAAPDAPKVQPAEVAGSVLARLTVLPAVLMLAWLIPGVPLLLTNHFLPVPMVLISVPLAVALTVNGLRIVPVSWPRLMPRGTSAEREWTTWFGLLATVAVIAGLIAWQLAESSEALIVVRDPGTYLQAGYWIAQHGSLPIPEAVKAFGGAHPGLSFTSTGFLQRGTSLYPAAMPGLPLLLAGGFWVHGITGASAIGPILGGLAALTFAGLVARLVGPQWAPGGALLLGLSLPEQYVGRTSLSETALQILIFGGLSLLTDSLVVRGALAAPGRVRARVAPGRWSGGQLLRWRQSRPAVRFGAWLTPQRALAGLAGLALASGLVVSLDSVVYLLPVIPFGGILVAGRRPQATTFLAGLFLGLCYGLAGGYLLDRAFLDTVGKTLAVAAIAALWLIALMVVVFQGMRLPRVRTFVPAALAGRPLRWLPEFGALLAAAILIGFAVRPYVQRVHGHSSPAVQAFIASLQRVQGLPVDPTRLYSEQTLYWVIWYVGLPTVLLGGFGVVLLIRRCLQALITWRDPDGVFRVWGLPLAIICAGSAVVLWTPDILPDQPWASRRLVVMVVPGLIICGLWAAAVLARRARDRGAKSLTAGVAGLFCTAAMLVPTVATTFGVGLSHTGKSGGLQPVAQGLALRRTGAGQIEAIDRLCAQIPRNASVVILDWPVAQQFMQVIRGMCGVPVAFMPRQPAATVSQVIDAITAASRRPVLLAATEQKLAAFGGSAVRALDLFTAGDPHDLTQLPTAPDSVHYQVWLTVPATSPGLGT